MLNYIGNARIITGLDELPKIGEQHELYKARVVSVTAHQNEKHPDFIFYTVLYGESFNKNDIVYFDIDLNTFTFSYAINKKDMFGGSEQ